MPHTLRMSCVIFVPFSAFWKHFTWTSSSGSEVKGRSRVRHTPKASSISSNIFWWTNRQPHIQYPTSFLLHESFSNCQRSCVSPPHEHPKPFFLPTTAISQPPCSLPFAPSTHHPFLPTAQQQSAKNKGKLFVQTSPQCEKMILIF